ncbi:regulator of G-protein signaling 20-like isoform X1 [Pristis pectinata]|uniref:regulator of G-protein signaling 20-like isoform X1 n=2 Tax=Pristis pectinata TaxID=685728 RepID=UPI00223DB6B4|nr:regulator of G-protein signaling 20-like isoform X1 [Pristis pectinata]
MHELIQCTRPVKSEKKHPMSQNENFTTTQSAGSHRSNACCLCWCCCCSYSWREDDDRNRRPSHNIPMENMENCEPSANPTAEEVHLWAQSFDKLLKTPAGRNTFREFLRTEYSEENMLFWLACEDLKNEANRSAIEDKARIIYEDFISILSPKEVSLDSRVREVINTKMAEPSNQIFDDAQLQIYTLMHRDSYPRFLNSSIYKSLLQRSSSTSSES